MVKADIITATQKCGTNNTSVLSLPVVVLANINIDTLAVGLIYLPVKLSRNQLTHNVAPETYIGNRSDLQYLLDIYVPEYALATSPTKLLETNEATEKPPYVVAGVTYQEGAFFLDINEVLDSFLKNIRPDFGQLFPKSCPEEIISFKLTSTILPTNTAVAGQVQYILKGGLSHEDFADYRDTFFTDYLESTKSFLTFQPNYKPVVLSQPEYLYFLTNFRALPSQLRLRMEVLYDDGTTEKFTKQVASNLQLFNVYCFAVGPEVLGISSTSLTNPSKRVLQYSVWLNNGNDFRVSEIRSYYLDYKCYRNSRFILFNNSIGGYDTLHCTMMF